MALSARNSEVIYAGDYGDGDQGVYKTTNGGQTWVAVNSGLTNTTIHALALDHVDDQIVFVGTTQGGVFKSIDGGENWHPVNKGLSQDYVGVLTIDPTNGQIIYAGTNGGGVFRSTDGAESWNAPETGSDFRNQRIHSLAIDPDRKSVV